jgi:hypothetical protein
MFSRRWKYLVVAPLFVILPLLLVACGSNVAGTGGTGGGDTIPDTTATTAATPVFAPAPGTYAERPTVSISCSTPGAEIYYTVDDSVPTTASTRYTGSFRIESTPSGITTVRAIAAGAGMITSAVASARYAVAVTIPQPVERPVIQPPAGAYTNSVTVSIASATANAEIFYTLDDSLPSTASTRYTGPFTIAPAASGTTTVRAMAARTGMTDSVVASAAYAITVVPVTGIFVADYTVAKESALRAIPQTYIDTARTTLHIAYNHTSHGTHVSYGAYGLPGFKSGDAARFAITRNAATPDPTRLDFHDDEIGGAYSDLSQADANWATWRDQVRAYLDNPAHAAINVMMWSWCDIAGHSVPDYLSSMQTLINEYGPGGSKIGTGTGDTRTTPVTFIFMTGHANVNSNTGAGHPREQARLITDYCTAHGYYCIDYYSIDTHAMDDHYYEDTGDDGNSAAYGGNFYVDWQGAHSLGADWYRNRNSPGGSETYGEHNTQHITANRKAFAFWWVLARIAGYP